MIGHRAEQGPGDAAAAPGAEHQGPGPELAGQLAEGGGRLAGDHPHLDVSQAEPAFGLGQDLAGRLVGPSDGHVELLGGHVGPRVAGAREHLGIGGVRHRDEYVGTVGPEQADSGDEGAERRLGTVGAEQDRRGHGATVATPDPRPTGRSAQSSDGWVPTRSSLSGLRTMRIAVMRPSTTEHDSTWSTVPSTSTT